MARSKSTTGTKASRTGTDASTSNSNKEQANSVTPASIPEVKSSRREIGRGRNPDRPVGDETTEQGSAADPEARDCQA